MKVADVLNPNFQAAFLKLTNCDLEISTAYRLKNISDKLQDALAEYEGIRQQALQDLGTKSEDGSLLADDQGTIQIESQNLVIFTDRINQALNKEVEVTQFSVEELAGAKLSVNDLVSLEELIKE